MKNPFWSPWFIRKYFSALRVEGFDRDESFDGDDHQILSEEKKRGGGGGGVVGSEKGIFQDISLWMTSGEEIIAALIVCLSWAGSIK